MPPDGTGSSPETTVQAASPQEDDFRTDPDGFAGRCTDYIHYSDGNRDNLRYRHFPDCSVVNVTCFDGHVDSVNCHQCQMIFTPMLTGPDPFEFMAKIISPACSVLLQFSRKN